MSHLSGWGPGTLGGGGGILFGDLLGGWLEINNSWNRGVIFFLGIQFSNTKKCFRKKVQHILQWLLGSFCGPLLLVTWSLYKMFSSLSIASRLKGLPSFSLTLL